MRLGASISIKAKMITENFWLFFLPS